MVRSRRLMQLRAGKASYSMPLIPFHLSVCFHRVDTFDSLARHLILLNSGSFIVIDINCENVSKFVELKKNFVNDLKEAWVYRGNCMVPKWK